MPIILDACSIINLFNATALEGVCSLERETFHVTPHVMSECSPECAAEVARLQNLGHVEFVGDDDIPVDYFLELVENHDIGDGELECIAACAHTGFDFCSDDGPARRLGQAELGNDRVVGSLRLLRWAVEDEQIDCATAYAYYEQMKVSGGFLPKTPQAFFCPDGDC